MATRTWRKLAMLHAIEATYMTDAAPTAADAIIGTNISFTPIEAEEVSRDLLLPYMGNQGMVLAAEYGRIEFEVEIAGAGAAGDVPKYGSLLRICGLAETVTAATMVEYEIVENAVESGTLYFNSDGVQHIFLGSQATVQLTFTPKQIPKFRFTMLGMLGTITDAALPAVSMAGWITPLVVSKASTTMTLHGWSAVAESLSVDLGNTLTPRFLIGDELIKITDRSTTGTTVVEARHLAQIDWFAKAHSRERGALSFAHGTVAGNIVEVSAPAVEIGKPTQGETDGIVNYSLPLSFCPIAGMDELKITVR
ncbi:phage tail tube protein [uncultured Sulfitobacter sp.]|uniref:phage tail tube protein n=1 Tax=uncultured Sulfitobacter sp. TaxID=191468 RepID=UPI0025951B52|nr:phage tail tube protein [uncultured Sulfitobacter sp.]